MIGDTEEQLYKRFAEKVGAAIEAYSDVDYGDTLARNVEVLFEELQDAIKGQFVCLECEHMVCTCDNDELTDEEMALMDSEEYYRQYNN